MNTSKDTIYRLRPHDADSFDPARRWINEIASQLFCNECNSLLELDKAVDCVVQNPHRDSDLDFVFGFRLIVARSNLLMALGESTVEKCFYSGKVLDEAGLDLANYRTVIGREQLYVRGTKCEHRICPTCDTLLYRPLGDLYVVRPSRSFPIYQSQSVDLLVCQELYKTRLGNRKLERVQILELPIIETPLDGLPLNLSDLREGK